MNLDLSRKDIVTISGVFVSFLIFALLVSNLSVGFLVNIQNSFLKSMLLETRGMTTMSAIGFIINQFYTLLLAMIFVVLGFSFLSSYGFFKDERKIALFSGICILPVLIVFRFSITSILLSAGIIITNIFVMSLSNTYGKELKRWVLFRVGSNSIGKALMIINIMIAVGVFLSLLYNLSYYQNNFKSDLSSTLEKIVAESVPFGQQLPKEEISKQITAAIDNMPLFDAYIRWLPLLTAFGVWAMLEFLRVFLPLIGGIFTFVMIKLQKKK
ncbi:MAG: hypothetical protein V1900_02375 [Candidatus Aenigmatarchaeota archaeon]